jgi:hypothetical protein
VAEANGGGAAEGPETDGGTPAQAGPPERRKRKSRGASPAEDQAPRPDPRERMRRGYAKAEVKNEEARAALEPLAEGQRPRVVTIGALVSAVIAISIVVGYVSGVKVNGETPKFAQVAAPTLIMGVMAWGMWRAKYWAVLGFQLILAFLIFGAFFGLAAQASSVAQFAATTGLLLVCGTFFVFMVKAMARIQMPNRLPRE